MATKTYSLYPSEQKTTKVPKVLVSERKHSSDFSGSKRASVETSTSRASTRPASRAISRSSSISRRIETRSPAAAHDLGDLPEDHATCGPSSRFYDTEELYESNSLYIEPSLRSSSPTLVPSRCESRADTIAGVIEQGQTLSKKSAPDPIRSIFPTYNHELPANGQYYFPTQLSPRNIPEEHLHKAPYSPDFAPSEPAFETPNDGSGSRSKFAGPSTEMLSLSKLTSMISASSGHSHSYIDKNQIPGFWKLLEGRPKKTKLSERYQLRMHRRQEQCEANRKPNRKKTRSGQTYMNFGSSEISTLLTATTRHCNALENEAGEFGHKVQLTRADPNRRFFPDAQQAENSAIVSEFSLSALVCSPEVTNPERTPDKQSLPVTGDKEDQLISTITPHAANLDSLAKAASSMTGRQLADSDPTASSEGSRQLAKQALDQSRWEYGSDLIFTASPLSRLGHWGYALRHPRLGVLPIEVDGDVRLSKTDENDVEEQSRPKPNTASRVVLHLPTSVPLTNSVGSPKAKTAVQGKQRETCALAAIDLKANSLSLTIDSAGEGLTQEDPYITATILSALVGVVFAETLNSRVSHLNSFLPPPTCAFDDIKLAKSSSIAGTMLRKVKSSRQLGRSTSEVTQGTKWIDGNGKEWSSRDMKTSKRQKSSLAGAETAMEDGMTVALGAFVYVLSAAVDGLADLAAKTKPNKQS